MTSHVPPSLQLEEEKADVARQLEHERQARLMQERVNEENLKFAQELTEKNLDRDAHSVSQTRLSSPPPLLPLLFVLFLETICFISAEV